MYALQQDIVDRYGDGELFVVFDRDGDGAIDAAVVAQALTDASEEIDGYLAGRYRLPLATPPKILTFLCVDIALYKGSVGLALTDEKRRRYEDAVRFLTKVAEGKISLGVADQTAPAAAGGAEFVGAPRQLSRTSMKDLL